MQLFAVALAAAIAAPVPSDAAEQRGVEGQELSNRSFQIKHDASGITSLKRTGDVADTDYIASGGALGRLVVRYRTTPHGDWKELRDLVTRPGASANEIRYALASLLPTMASFRARRPQADVEQARGRPVRSQTSRSSRGPRPVARRSGSSTRFRPRKRSAAPTSSGPWRHSRGACSTSRADSGRKSRRNRRTGAT